MKEKLTDLIEELIDAVVPYLIFSITGGTFDFTEWDKIHRFFFLMTWCFGDYLIQKLFKK